MKKLLIAGMVIAAAYFWGAENGLNSAPQEQASRSGRSDKLLAEAFETRRTGYQIQGGGKVVRLLGDDNEGSRHQRFLIRLESGQTLLVAHNIDLAARLDSLQVGDYVAFNGEYEWNPQGGVIHWTHHAPRGRHEAGWLKHNGQTYQ
ncbi:MAG: DUF3465 domain-containing protein [Chromatocurvus sp.]